MTTSAPQWPGQEDVHEPPTGDRGSERPTVARRPSAQAALGTVADGGARALPPPCDAGPSGLQPIPDAGSRTLKPIPRAGSGALRPMPDADPRALRLAPGSAIPGPAGPGAQGRGAAGRRGRLVVVADPVERDPVAKRRRARGQLPSPAAVTRDIALALLEVEAGCRSAGQLERIFSPALWEALEHRIGRRGGPLPTGRSLISVVCQEDTPGLADTVAVVCKGDVVRPVALRLDASGGRWKVTELRWWRNETDTATTSG